MPVKNRGTRNRTRHGTRGTRPSPGALWKGGSVALFGVGGNSCAYHSGLSYLRGTHYESVPGKSIPYVENGSRASRCWLFYREGWDCWLFYREGWARKKSIGRSPWWKMEVAIPDVCQDVGLPSPSPLSNVETDPSLQTCLHQQSSQHWVGGCGGACRPFGNLL